MWALAQEDLVGDATRTGAGAAAASAGAAVAVAANHPSGNPQQMDTEEDISMRLIDKVIEKTLPQYAQKKTAQVMTEFSNNVSRLMKQREKTYLDDKIKICGEQQDT